MYVSYACTKWVISGTSEPIWMKFVMRLNRLILNCTHKTKNKNRKKND